MSNNQNKDVEDNKLIAAIGHIGVLCFAPLMLKKRASLPSFTASSD